VWRAIVADRVLKLTVDGGKISAATHAGVSTTLNADGTGSATVAEEMKVVDPAPELAAGAMPGRMLKLTSKNGDRTAAVYWGGMIQIVGADGKTIATQQHDQDITAIVWSGDRLITGDADGKVVAYDMK